MESSESGRTETASSAEDESAKSPDDAHSAAVGRTPSPAIDPSERSSEVEAEQAALPDRYEIREVEGQRVLRCEEAPGIEVRIDAGCSFTDSEARRLGQRVILLDGAGSFPPLLDNDALLYNLDHHQGVYRSLTLATCEQAMVLVAKGLELDRGRWTVYANEPDLDTILAIWLLLNHRRVRELRPAAKDILFPIVRLEGAIDANGFAAAEFCGLPQDSLERARASLDRLLERELELKRTGSWESHDRQEYTGSVLGEIDRMVYRISDFADYARVEEEYEHVEIGHDKVAVVCRDASGIYEVEDRLRRLWDERLAIIALEKGERHYTLRRTASFSRFDLRQAYYRLNLLDPVVDGRPPDKQWGGSDEIGGSPRPDGTGLEPSEIAQILSNSFRRPGRFTRLAHIFGAGLWTVVVAALIALVLTVRRYRSGSLSDAGPPGLELSIAALALGLCGWLLIGWFSHRKSWLFGWRRPAGRDWLWAVPVALLGASLGGTWLPNHAAEASTPPAGLFGAMILAAVAGEIWFRGFVHGIQMLDAPVQRIGGSWFVSQASMIAAFGYAVVTAVVSGGLIAASPLAAALPASPLVVLFGAAIGGLALGAIRERSLSLWPGAGVQALGALLLLAIRYFLPLS